MKKGIFREWFHSLFYPRPGIDDSDIVWEEFAEKANYRIVEKIASEFAVCDCLVRRKTIIALLFKRLRKGDWPVLTDEFMKNYESVIFQVDSLTTAKQEVADNYDSNEVKYLVDKNRQMLGVVVNKGIIIQSVVNVKTTKAMAAKLKLQVSGICLIL